MDSSVSVSFSGSGDEDGFGVRNRFLRIERSSHQCRVVGDDKMVIQNTKNTTLQTICSTITIIHFRQSKTPKAKKRKNEIKHFELSFKMSCGV